MFNSFAQWCDLNEGRQRRAMAKRRFANHHPFRSSTLQALCFFCLAPAAGAHVGLPEAADPLHGQAPQREQQAEQMVIRQISYGAEDSDRAGFSCQSNEQLGSSSLNFAPPADTRADNWSAAELADADLADHIPLIISGDRAALRSGEVVSSANALRDDERIVLISADADYFNRLQDIRPKDTLIVQTTRHVRQYQVTSARITQRGLSGQTEQDSSASLTLAACYPFQPLAEGALLFEVQAEPIVSAQAAAENDFGDYELVKF